MADEDFSPETHRFAPSRYFDDFRVGERFYIPSRTMTEAIAPAPSQSRIFMETLLALIIPNSAQKPFDSSCRMTLSVDEHGVR